MSRVRLSAIWLIAAAVSATGPPSPMFSPAAVQCTPAAVSLTPIAASPGHWCDRPQPLAMTWLCLRALVCRPVRIAYAGSPARARAWFITARTLATALPTVLPVPDGAGVDGAAAAGRRDRGR